MKKIYLIPNSITAFGLACGLFVIFKLTMTETENSDIYSLLQTSVVFLLIAALADLLDGTIARLMHAESEFGLMFDSLADAISFGVAPSVLLIRSLNLKSGEPTAFIVMSCAMLFSICAVLRLVRFNVNAGAVKGDALSELAHRKHFTGLPIDAAALASISAVLAIHSPFAAPLQLTETARALILASIMVILGYFMVSRWKFPSLKVLKLRRAPPFQLVVGTVIISLILLYGTIHFFPIVLALFAWGYLLLAWTLSIIRLLSGRNSETLKEFEPDEESDDDDPSPQQ